VPYNIFKDGGVTPDALQYLYLNGTASGTNVERTVHADITGDLGRYGVKSPLATNGFSVNLGYEYRADERSLTGFRRRQWLAFRLRWRSRADSSVV